MDWHILPFANVLQNEPQSSFKNLMLSAHLLSLFLHLLMIYIDGPLELYYHYNSYWNVAFFLFLGVVRSAQQQFSRMGFLCFTPFVSALYTSSVTLGFSNSFWLFQSNASHSVRICRAVSVPLLRSLHVCSSLFRCPLNRL